MNLQKLLLKLDGEKEYAAEISASISHVGLFSALCREIKGSEHEDCSTEVIATAFALIKKCPEMSTYDALRASYDIWIKE
jgi:molybdopterin converting factor small subunit